MTMRGAIGRCWVSAETEQSVASDNAVILAGGGVSVGQAADLPSRRSIIEQPAAIPSPWTFRFTPYGWLTSLNGTQTVRGRSVDVDASFVDIIDATLGSGGTLVGLMADFEARNGPVSFWGISFGLRSLSTVPAFGLAPLHLGS
jgi:hypothetical protein